jgi:hypothetical protein
VRDDDSGRHVPDGLDLPTCRRWSGYSTAGCPLPRPTSPKVIDMFIAAVAALWSSAS